MKGGRSEEGRNHSRSSAGWARGGKRVFPVAAHQGDVMTAEQARRLEVFANSSSGDSRLDTMKSGVAKELARRLLSEPRERGAYHVGEQGSR
jgi:hypothetical protein